MTKSDDILRALDELESALEAFRSAYTAWLAGEADPALLSTRLAEAESRLDAARALLADASDEQSYP